MAIPSNIVIYGNTLPLAGLAIALQNRMNLQVISIPGNRPEDMDYLNSLHPDVIFFDQAQSGVQPLLSDFSQHTSLVLIGMDANSNQMSVWSGRQMGVMTIDDILIKINQLSNPNI